MIETGYELCTHTTQHQQGEYPLTPSKGRKAMEEIETDRKSTDRHKSRQIHFWLDPKRLEKLDTIATLSGKNRTDIIKRFIDGTDLSKLRNATYEKELGKVLAELGKIGGLMKLNRIGTPEQVNAIFSAIKEIRKIAYGNVID